MKPNEYLNYTFFGFLHNQNFFWLLSVADRTYNCLGLQTSGFRETITDNRYLDIIGRRSVMTGCISYSTCSLAVEEHQFEIIDDGQKLNLK